LYRNVSDGQVQAAFNQNTQGVLAGRGEPILFPLVERLLKFILLFLFRFVLGFFLVVLIGGFIFLKRKERETRASSGARVCQVRISVKRDLCSSKRDLSGCKSNLLPGNGT
jgi:hypothetical protein